MNKLCVLDLDGTLADLKDLHFEALNRALEWVDSPPISRDDHLSCFDGHPTYVKLQMLGIVGGPAAEVRRYKQDETIRLLPKYVKPIPQMAELFHKVIAAGWLIGVCSNAKHETVTAALEFMQLNMLVCWVHTPDGCKMRSKPSPEMLLSMMLKADACPMSTVVFEDGPSGLHAAHYSGAKVVQVDSPADMTEDFVLGALREERQDYRFRWPMLNVLIPAAGEGRRFAEAGYQRPKPFIEVYDNRTMLACVVDNLCVDADKIFVLQRKDMMYTHQDDGLGPFGQFRTLSGYTRGTAESCLVAARDDIDNRYPLLIANSDQLLEWDAVAFYYFAKFTNLDGIVVVFDCPERDKRWSYCKLRNDGTVEAVVEKDPVSDLACTGVWFFKRGSDFVKHARDLIRGEMLVKGEYYISSVYNMMIGAGLRIGTFKVDKMHGLGDPESLEKYLAENQRG